MLIEKTHERDLQLARVRRRHSRVLEQTRRVLGHDVVLDAEELGDTRGDPGPDDLHLHFAQVDALLEAVREAELGERLGLLVGPAAVGLERAGLVLAS